MFRQKLTDLNLVDWVSEVENKFFALLYQFQLTVSFYEISDEF